MLRSIAEQTGGAASINEADLAPALAQAVADLDHYFVLSFPPSGPADGKFHPVQVRVKRAGRAGAIAVGLLGADASGRRSRRESGGCANCRCPSGRRTRARTSARGSACLADPTG